MNMEGVVSLLDEHFVDRGEDLLIAILHAHRHCGSQQICCTTDHLPIVQLVGRAQGVEYLEGRC